MSIAIMLAAVLQAAEPAAAVAPAAPAAAPEKPVCRTFNVTGSRLGRSRVCHTKREWDEAEAVARRRTDQIQGASINR